MAAVQNWEKKKKLKENQCWAVLRNRNSRPPAVIRADFRIHNHGSQKN
jgi:hypothetical protein